MHFLVIFRCNTKERPDRASLKIIYTLVAGADCPHVLINAMFLQKKNAVSIDPQDRIITAYKSKRNFDGRCRWRINFQWLFLFICRGGFTMDKSNDVPRGHFALGGGETKNIRYEDTSSLPRFHGEQYEPD